MMELTAGCRDRSTLIQSSDWITDAFTCLQKGSCPSHSAADLAGVIFSGVCGLLPSEDGDRTGPGDHHVNSVELSCISVSLVEKITSTLTSGSLHPPAVTLYCVEILSVLFQHKDLMSHLIHQFHNENQIISHLAAKTVSTCVFYQLHKSGTVSPVWQQKCGQAFSTSVPGPELDACLWSLTEVLKRLIKGAHQDILGKLLAAFDSSLSALWLNVFPEERKEVKQCWVDLTSLRHSGATFCLLLDLLEVITASSLVCETGVWLKSARITQIHFSALLTTISCASEYFVKKRVLLFLKRAVLQKPGEDWALGEVPFTELKYKHTNSDRDMLAQSVLTAVANNWLQSVQVESASFFGGTRHIRDKEGQKLKDCVMLRAVSLLLLKSMELHIQTAGGTGVDSATELYGCLQSLWGFLRRCGVQLTESTHRCSWISLLFGEQDDDMMEAARALLFIFLHHRLCSGLDEVAVLEAACASGCNPHCHFLLLLQSISFDHSILLDFLISTETCFLEYFVRYLKYLRADWQGFTAACRRISLPKCHLPLQHSLTASYGGNMQDVTSSMEPDRVESSSSVQPVGGISVAAGVHLVDYETSDESDPEDMEVSQDEPGASECKKGRFSALYVKQDINRPPEHIGQKQHKSSDSTGLLSEPASIEGPSLLLLQSEKTGRLNMAPLGQVTCETLARAVLCMSKLREVMTRLQTKKLFPYNPSSLLKLLAQVEDCF
ncbi:protein Lines homolog 1 isoform X2 [Centropristis striata]|uniref:protein Lines homolog 1 isoform X2 n=1 Tax=Centropristis striata TaxID=184440 RepID=UPI0027E0A467|nr:protein Lines homolog 1 isoform X2 [Centropristis striata]